MKFKVKIRTKEHNNIPSGGAELVGLVRSIVLFEVAESCYSNS